ncbi:MAG: hypothetical protein KGQ79_02350 [Proteobacteria bacterium]|nr:hypothetical protein [Pseudomonadota bacterium]MBU6425829.1 hypothetical protein [Rhodospirillales bacterium]
MQFEIVEIRKQLLITRGVRFTFPIANDISKFFMILRAIFVGTYPQRGVLNVMHCAAPRAPVYRR